MSDGGAREQVHLYVPVLLSHPTLLHLMVKSQVPNWSAEGTELTTQTLTGTLQSPSIPAPKYSKQGKLITHKRQSQKRA
jgi:hypothetical protein